jgi:hypothetical protein
VGCLPVSSTRIGFLCFLQVGDTSSQPMRLPHFYMAWGSVNFLWILKALFLFLDPYLLFAWIRSFYNNRNIFAFINTFAMCHSTRSRRRRRRAATPATTPTRPTWMWRGRRRTTTPSRPTRMRWTRTRPSSRRGPPRLQNLDVSRAPWYATPFRLNIPLLLD